MNLKTTLALVALAACAAGVVFTHGHLPPDYDPFGRQPVATQTLATPAALRSLTAGSLKSLRIRHRDRDAGKNVRLAASTLIVTRPSAWAALADAPLTDASHDRVVKLDRAGDSWVMPGNWQTRPGEVGKLFDLLTHLESRFEPLALDETTTKEFGLDNPGVVVTVETKEGKTHTLAFGEPPAGSRFDRPTYLRLDDNNEALRLAPGVVAAFDRPDDYYLQRRLFPVARVPREEGSSAHVERPAAKRIEVEEIEVDLTPKKDGKDGKQTAEKKRTARRFALEGRHEAAAGGKGASAAPDAWELAEPYRDALDPSARDRLLEAVADLWAEKFVEGEDAKDENTGLKEPGAPKDDGKVRPQKHTLRRITVTREDGRLITLHVGKQTDGGLPLPGQKARYYASLAGSERIFEVNGDKLEAIFPPLDRLRDSELARFTPADAREIELTTTKGTVLLRNETKPRPAGSEETPPPPADWRIVKPAAAKADSALVERLLSALSGANALEKDVAEKARLGGVAGTVTLPATNPLAALASALLLDPLGEFGLKTPAATIKVSVEEGKRDEPKKKKTIIVRLGRHDRASKRLFAMSQDWPRINEIADELAGLALDKSALDFRNKRLLDFAPKDVKQLVIRKHELKIDVAGEKVALPWLARLGLMPVKLVDDSSRLVLERSSGGWEMTAPVKTEADAFKAGNLAEQLSKLDVLSWVASEARPDKAQSEYGLGEPVLSVSIEFIDGKKPTKTLLLGRPRPGEPGLYAKLQGAPEVFVVPDSVAGMLEQDSLSYRPASLWHTTAPDVVKLTIARAGQDEYVLQRKGDDWEVSGPFSVKAPKQVVDRLLLTLASPFALSYRAHAAKDYTQYGLAAPAVKVTLTTKQGKQHTLWLGASAGPFGGRFGRLGEKGEAVFVVDDGLARAADQSALDFLDRELLKFNPEDAVSFTRVKGDDVLELTKTDDVWKLVKPNEAAADDQKVPALFRSLAGLRAERIVAYKPKDLAPFGLDKPAATVTVKLAGEKPAESVLLLGGEVKDRPGGRYAMLRGAPIVGELSAESVNRLLAGPLTYRDHLVARLPDADVIKLESGDRKATFSKPEGTWKLTQPLTGEADHDALEALVTALARLRADEFVAEKATPEQLKAYGLDRPFMRWQFVVDDQTKLDLLVGAAEKGGVRRYAKLQGGDAVFLLDAKLSPRVTAEYRPRTVFKEPIDPARIESVKFGYLKEPFELKKADEGWQVVGKADAKVNAKALTDALAVLRDLKLERYVADDKAQLKLYGLDPPELTLEVATEDGKQTLLIGGLEGGTKKRYARLASKAADVFLLDEAASTKLFASLASLTEK
jgi:hypothetical protein